MSLIACTNNFNVPFIVGDILLSDLEGSKSIPLPTNSIDINRFLNFPNGSPAGLGQKIYVIRPDLCIALAGSVPEMKNFLESLTYYSKIHSDRNTSKEFVFDFLDYFNVDADFTESAFFILIIENISEENGEAFQIYYPPKAWEKRQSEIYGEIVACGTGKNSFLNRATQNSKYKSSHQKGDPNFAVQFNIGLFARILAEEMVSGSTTMNFWGAGFETILYANESFIKFPEITYVIWVGFYTPDGKFENVLPHLVMHYKYYDDMLLIRSFEITAGKIELENGMYSFISYPKVSTYEVPRLDVPISKYRRPMDLSFGTYRTGLGYATITSENVINTLAYYNDTTAVEVIYDEPFNKLTVKVLKDIQDQMLSSAESVYHTLLK